VDTQNQFRSQLSHATEFVLARPCDIARPQPTIAPSVIYITFLPPRDREVPSVYGHLSSKLGHYPAKIDAWKQMNSWIR
jgi:hypothetical protein